MTTFQILALYKQAFLNGLTVTLYLCLVIWSIGLGVGGVVGILGARLPRTVGEISRVGSFLLSGVPVLVFLFWLHYPLQAILGVVVRPFITAAVTLSIINVFTVAELVRNAIHDFPSQYEVAARVCGLTTRDVLVNIKVPILLRQIVPSLLMAQVGMLQTTLFASLISVDEIFRVSQRINAEIYRPVQIYTALGIFFLLICLPLNGLAAYLRSRYGRDLSER